MEIRLGILEEKEKTQFQFYETISIEEYKLIKQSIAEVSNYSQSIKLLELVVLNERDMHDFIVRVMADIQKKSVNWNGVSYQDIDFYRIEANRFLLNFLSSFRTFLDHSETILKRKFGNDSNQFKEYKTIQSFIYDSNFSYRFIYKLRNYCQHCGLPLWFNHSITKIQSTDKAEIKIIIFFDKKHLLESYDSWGITKNEIIKLPDIIDFFPYFNEATNQIVEIANSFKSIIKTEIKASAEFLLEKTKHLRKMDKKVCIFSEIKTDENGALTNFSIEYIPFDIIDEIMD